MKAHHNIANVEIDLTDAEEPTLFVTMDGGEQLYVTAKMALIEPLMAALADIVFHTAQPDCDDSDDDFALASAGFGTDEDYGGYH